jgi:hypothetical protein
MTVRDRVDKRRVLMPQKKDEVGTGLKGKRPGQVDLVILVHHKTGATVWYPLEEKADDGVVQCYADAEAVLARATARNSDDPEIQA